MRDSKGHVEAMCDGLCNGPYFAPDPHNWASEFHVGGKKGGPTPQVKYPPRVFTPELATTMRSALRLRFLLDQPKFDGEEDLDLFSTAGLVYYARQGLDFVKEINTSQNFS